MISPTACSASPPPPRSTSASPPTPGFTSEPNLTTTVTSSTTTTIKTPSNFITSQTSTSKNDLRQKQTQTPIISFQQEAASDSAQMSDEPTIGRFNSSSHSTINLFSSNPSSSISTEHTPVFASNILHSNNDGCSTISTGDSFEVLSPKETDSATMEAIESHFFEGVEKLLEVASPKT